MRTIPKKRAACRFRPFQLRRGAIAVFAAIMLVAMVCFLALSLDVGFIMNVRTELQRSVDAGAFAGTGTLVEGPAATITAARQYVRANMGPRQPLDDEDINVELGKWNQNGRFFESGETPFDAVRVTARRNDFPLFFGPATGTNRFEMSASAVATYRPRDIMLVLDYSGSMNTQNKVGALKDAVTLFISTLQEAQGEDRVGFSVYSTEGALAEPLTLDLPRIDRSARSRSAGGWTNMGEGMEFGRQELLANRRARALSLMLVMTDGMANRPLNRDPFQYVRDEANLAAAAEIPIVAISFTEDSDQRIMREIAEITGGVHFHIEGTVSQQERELQEVFRDVARRRPLRLVQ